MSYNITRWNTKKLVDFKIPISAFKGLDCYISATGSATKITYIESWIEGTLNGDWLFVTEIDIQSEGSGTFMQMLRKILHQSTGELVAARIWEGGDSIDRIEVKDGVFVETPIEV